MRLIEKYCSIDINLIRQVPGIYYIQCKVNGMLYIGETNDILDRLSYHIQRLLKNTHDNPHLQNAVNKYGINQFLFEVAELCEEKDLKRREHHWATVLYVHDRSRGYNIQDTEPGEKKKVSEESRRRMSIAQKNSTYQKKPVSEETRIRIGNVHRGKKTSEETKEKLRQINTGKKASEETKKKIGDASRGKKRGPMSEEARKNVKKGRQNGIILRGKDNPNSRSVIKYRLDGKLIQIYDSIRQAESRDGYSSMIAECCTGKTKMALGYMWRYYSNDYQKQIEPYTNKRWLKKYMDQNR